MKLEINAGRNPKEVRKLSKKVNGEELIDALLAPWGRKNIEEDGACDSAMKELKTLVRAGQTPLSKESSKRISALLADIGINNAITDYVDEEDITEFDKEFYEELEQHLSNLESILSDCETKAATRMRKAVKRLLKPLREHLETYEEPKQELGEDEQDTETIIVEFKSFDIDDLEAKLEELTPAQFVKKTLEDLPRLTKADIDKISKFAEKKKARRLAKYLTKLSVMYAVSDILRALSDKGFNCQEATSLALASVEKTLEDNANNLEEYEAVALIIALASLEDTLKLCEDN